jgi:hypothetical protein
MDFVEKSFASAGETSKLLITLSTALVAFCATVVNVKAAEPTLFSPATTCQKLLLATSWLLLLMSIAVGLWAQLAITDVLSKGSEIKPTSAWDRKITVPFQMQISTFLVGILVLTAYGFLRLFG